MKYEGNMITGMKKFWSKEEEELYDDIDDDLEVMDLDEEYYETEDFDMEVAGDEVEYYGLEEPERESYYEPREMGENGEDYEIEEIEPDEEYYESEETEDDEEYSPSEETEGDEEYFELEETEGDEEYYESEEAEDDEEYYESEETESDGEYYESEENDEEFYEMIEDLDDEECYESEEAEDDEKYYESEETESDGEYCESEENDEEFYEMIEDLDDEEYYEDEVYEDEDYDTESEETYSGRETVFTRIFTFLRNMTAMDRLIAATGVLVLVFVAVAGSNLVNARISAGQVEAFAELGTNLNDMIGESGLVAVADATMAKQEAARLVENGQTEEGTEVLPEGGSIEVSMNLSSIQQDLKIKFINTKSTKLIASVPFEVEVTDAGNKTYTLKDEDMDGIIYQTGLTAGKYSISMVKLSDEKYRGYSISTAAKQVTVKDKIEYKKVDVADEIKTESEVNASAEDTKVKETVVESTNTDTVAFVESTKTELDGDSYKEINKAAITDPATVSGLFHMDHFVKLSNVATNALTVKRGESVNVTTSLTGEFITWISDNEEVVSVDGSRTGNDNTITGKKGGTASVTAGNGTDTETFQVTVEETQFTLNKDNISLSIGKTETLTASVEVTWSSEDASVASVDENGVVTGIKQGTTKIVATAADGSAASCLVTISENSTTISPTSLSIKVGETAVPTITVVGPDAAVIWTSSDASVATVELNGTITGVKAGTATITGTANGISASCTVTVTDKDAAGNGSDAANDVTTALKDNSGNPVYVQNASGEYVAAVYADYYKYDKFYIKAPRYKYTGWQTIDGSVYYYDVNGNVVTGTQVIQGATYNFVPVTGALVTSSGVLGIDVSKWNGSIDWNAVKNSGVNYVIIRCGYRGSSTGALIEDPAFRTNIKGATSAGLKVGIYFFTQAVNEVEAVEEASMVLSLISGYNISYPVFLDVEPSGGRADGISAETRTAVCNAFCQTVANSGYAAGIYANKTWLGSKINVGSLGGSYKIWLAQYAAAPSYGGKYQLWQYSSKGSVAGIKGDVDMNLSYLGY